MSFELIISVIALVVSILSPIFTAWINKSKELKLKELEVYEKRKLDNLEKYSVAVSSSLMEHSGSSKAFQENHTLIYMYAPEYLYPDIETLHSYCERPYEVPETYCLFSHIIDGRKLLAKILTACMSQPQIKWYEKIFRKFQQQNKKG